MIVSHAEIFVVDIEFTAQRRPRSKNKTRANCGNQQEISEPGWYIEMFWRVRNLETKALTSRVVIVCTDKLRRPTR